MFEYTKNELSNCKSEIKAIQKELKSLPDGYLIRKKDFYYRGLDGGQRGISKEPLLIRQLARKAYILKRLKYLEECLSAGREFLAHYRSLSPEEMINSLSKAYQKLSKDNFFLPPENGFQNQHYQKNPYHPEQLSIITNSGVAVRSKSEMIIADALDLYRIPYRYEAALELSGHVKYPDFTIKRPFDGKLIYWEHFGLMNEPDYVKSAMAKLQFYSENNIVPWRDLVFTFEEDVKNSRRLHQLIDWFILQDHQ